MKTVQSRGRPKRGLQVRQVTSIRLQPEDKKRIIIIFGSIQSWVDLCLEVLNKTGEKNAPIKKQ